MNLFTVLVVGALLLRFLLEGVSDLLNLRAVREELPAPFRGVYDAGRYRASQRYLRENTRFGLIKDSLTSLLLLGVILGGGFELVDRLARAPGWGDVPTGILFVGILGALGLVWGLPFSVYDTFVIEERYGFNKSTPRTFLTDILKQVFLGIVFGVPLVALVLWFFYTTGAAAWVWAWIGVVGFQFLMLLLAPYIILPLFNKYEPLKDDALRELIENYARRQNFSMKGVFQMDGSRRSSKSNAFFTGFGRSRRIVLYDTLIAQHTHDELLAIVAHEMGHYKRRHIPRAILRSVAEAGVTFWMMSLLVDNPALCKAFRLSEPSLYAGVVFFGFLYTPVSLVVSLVENALSRRHEFEADRYAAETTGKPDALISGLKRLSVDNLSNLTPHPFKVFLSYSHPPVLDRMAAIGEKSTT